VSEKLLVSTRKGLFTVSHSAGRWDIAAVDFVGDDVTLTLTDTRASWDCSFRRDDARRRAPPSRSDGMACSWRGIDLDDARGPSHIPAAFLKASLIRSCHPGPASWK
jgi:hypothetical protein